MVLTVIFSKIECWRLKTRYSDEVQLVKGHSMRTLNSFLSAKVVFFFFRTNVTSSANCVLLLWPRNIILIYKAFYWKSSFWKQIYFQIAVFQDQMKLSLCFFITLYGICLSSSLKVLWSFLFHCITLKYCRCKKQNKQTKTNKETNMRIRSICERKCIVDYKAQRDQAMTEEVWESKISGGGDFFWENVLHMALSENWP